MEKEERSINNEINSNNQLKKKKTHHLRGKRLRYSGPLLQTEQINR